MTNSVVVIQCIYRVIRRIKAMIKKLTKHGNSYALIIDRAILDLLNIDVDTLLEVTPSGRGLLVEPARSSKRRKKFERARAKIHKKYGGAFKRLAE